MGGTSWTLRITLPEPDAGAALHLTVVLETQTEPDRIARGRSTMWVDYPTEAAAREAMARVLAQRPDVRCSLEASPPPAES